MTFDCHGFLIATAHEISFGSSEVLHRLFCPDNAHALDSDNYDSPAKGSASCGLPDCITDHGSRMKHDTDLETPN